MAIAFSTSASGGSVGNSILGTAVTIPSGGTVLVSISSSNSNDQPVSLTDTGGNSYALVKAQAFGSTGLRSHLVFVAQNTLSATSFSVTMTKTGLSLMILVYTGVLSLGAITNSTGFSASTSLNLTTQDSNNWLASLVESDGLSTAAAASVGVQRVTQINQGIGLDNTVSTPGSLTTTVTWTAGPPNWSGIGVELRTVAAASQKSLLALGVGT